MVRTCTCVGIQFFRSAARHINVESNVQRLYTMIESDAAMQSGVDTINTHVLEVLGAHAGYYYIFI